MNAKDSKSSASQGQKNMKNGSGPGTCWFCGKPESNDRKLIHVKSGYICNQCVAAANVLLDNK